MLQRRLSIGYGRAAKILDMLEESGVIGPSNGAKPREVMVSAEEYELMDGGVSAMSTHKRAETSAPDNYLGEEDEAEDEADDDIPLVFKGGEDDDNNEVDEEEEEDDDDEVKDREDEPENDDEENIEEINDDEDGDEDKGEANEKISDGESEGNENQNEDEENNDDGETEAPAKNQDRKLPPRTPLDDDDEMFFAR
jgi:hypothetical protein